MKSSRIWAVRMPGGPTKIVRSLNGELTEEDAKEHYRESFTYRSTEADNDPDATWPLLKPIDEAEMTSTYGHFLEESAITGKPRALVEVDTGGRRRKRKLTEDDLVPESVVKPSLKKS
jgi:hypothetical protein